MYLLTFLNVLVVQEIMRNIIPYYSGSILGNCVGEGAEIVREIVREMINTVYHTISLIISSLMIWGAEIVREIVWEIMCTISRLLPPCCHFPCTLDLFQYHGGLGGEEHWKL